MKIDLKKDCNLALDGVTEESAALNYAIYQHPGASFYFSGLCKINQPVVVPAACTLEGDGFNTGIIAEAGYMDNLLKVAPTDNYYNSFMHIKKLRIGDPVIRYGTDAIRVELDPTINLAKFLMEDCLIGLVNNHGFEVVATGANGGFYCSTIQRNIINCGIKLYNVGDSNVLRENIIRERNCGINAQLVNGACLLSILDNNITSQGGSIRITRGLRVKIKRNNMECISTNFSPNKTMVDLDGIEGTLNRCDVEDNHFGSFTDVGTESLLRLNNAIGTGINGNTFLGSNCVGILRGSEYKTKVGFNQFGSGLSAKMRDFLGNDLGGGDDFYIGDL